nr:o-succinylbenzoate synthase [Hyella patelloides]
MSNQYHFHFKPYRRKFKKPLRTSHGVWKVREGIIITLRNSEGKIAQGEIAPIPWFGSEDTAEAAQFCQQQGNTITSEIITKIPTTLPACQFGFESALLSFNQEIKKVDENSLNYCYLLPTGKQVLEQEYQLKNKSSNPTFKWKIGIDETIQEIAIFKKLLVKLPHNARLRLDANGGLTIKQAQAWLEVTENNKMIEFIEQPLPPSNFQEMMVLQETYSTSLALDESVATISQLKDCYEKGWRDVFVIKSAIAGFPSHLRQFCQQHDLDLVFSSVFETSIGRQVALQLALELGNCDLGSAEALRDRAVGFSLDPWFSNY